MRTIILTLLSLLALPLSAQVEMTNTVDLTGTVDTRAVVPATLFTLTVNASDVTYDGTEGSGTCSEEGGTNSADANAPGGRAFVFADPGTTNLICGTDIDTREPGTVCVWGSMASDDNGWWAGKSLGTAPSWFLRPHTTEAFGLRLQEGTGSTNWDWDSNSNVLSSGDGSFDHMCATWDCSTGSVSSCSVQLYLNGNPITTNATNGTDGTFPKSDSTWEFDVGNRDDSGVDTDGRIAIVEVWPTALNANQIRSRYQEQVP